MSGVALVGEHRLVECGCCGHWHAGHWRGDCRDDAHRYHSPEDYAERNGLPPTAVLYEEDLMSRSAPIPWTLDADGDVQDACGNKIVDCARLSREEALLVAGAPRLLAALSALCSWYAHKHPTERPVQLDAARAAIAEARGYTP